jgi:aspartate racemase
MDDTDTMDTPALHARVYRELLPALAAAQGRTAAEAHLLRFKVLGGLGPAATADFLQELIAATPAARDREHLRLDVAVDPLMGLLPGEDPLPATQAALDHLLGGDSPTAFCLPCNSAHPRIEHLRYDRERVTFVSMIEATVQAVAAQVPGRARVGLLATASMVESGLYQAAFARAGLHVVVPDAALQRRVNMAVYGGEHEGRQLPGVKGGDLGTASTALVQMAVDALCEHGDVQALSLSCTELPLVFGTQRGGATKGDAHGRPVVNSTRALAHSFLQTALRLQVRELARALEQP